MVRRFIFLLAMIFLFTGLKAQVKDSVLFYDDPIAAMLDSLARNTYIAGIPKQPSRHDNKYHFPADSVPMYDPVVVEGRLAKLNSQSPFDLVYNDDVQAYVNLYTLRRRALVERMLGLSQLYYPIFEEMLDKYNLPLELKHLAVIESALNPTATSHSGARGLWQFMYNTGKMYDLEISSYVDERCDPYKSTEAACKLLQDLYSMFGDWQMVLAAYNAGPGTVSKAIRRAGGGKRSYWEIRPYLPRETQGYVPAFIAANYVMSYHAEHNLWSIAPRKAFFDIDTVFVKQQVTFQQLQSVLNVSYDELEFLNPMYKLGVIPVSLNKPYTLILPVDKVGSFVSNEKAIYDYMKKDSTASASVTIEQIKKIHTVKKGETISTIARRYKCSVSDIRTWNGLKSNYLKTGQKLTIYVAGQGPAKMNTTPAKAEQPTPQSTVQQPPANNPAPQPSSSGEVKYKYHTIQSGDNLWTVAKKYGTTVDELKRLNGFGSKVVLHTGQKIKVGKI